jgi:chaperonin GroES
MTGTLDVRVPISDEVGLAPATTGRSKVASLPTCGWSIRPAEDRNRRGGQIVTTATKVVLKPLEDRIVVQPLEAEQTTASGLVIPDTAKEKPQEGTVLAVGPGRWDDEGDKRIPLDVKVGDIVLYSKYGGTEVKYNNEEYLVLSGRDVLAIIEK